MEHGPVHWSVVVFESSVYDGNKRVFCRFYGDECSSASLINCTYHFNCLHAVIELYQGHVLEENIAKEIKWIRKLDLAYSLNVLGPNYSGWTRRGAESSWLSSRRIWPMMTSRKKIISLIMWYVLIDTYQWSMIGVCIIHWTSLARYPPVLRKWSKQQCKHYQWLAIHVIGTTKARYETETFQLSEEVHKYFCEAEDRIQTNHGSK